MLIPKIPKNRKSNTTSRQEMYDFWVQNSIVSKESANSATPVPKMTFFKKNKDINDPHIRQEAKIRKNGPKTKIVATKRIYSEYVKNLHQNSTRP